MASRRAELWERVSYRIDQLMAWNPVVKVLALFVGSLTLVVLGAAVFNLVVTTEGVDFFSSMWSSWSFVVDPAAHTGEEEAAGRWVGLVVSVGGLIVFALLIGLVSEGLAEKMDDLKAGRSRVVEQGHTVIVGWNERMMPLLQQLILANESEGGGAIAVLADRDKGEMEEQIKESIDDYRGTRIVCRQGSSFELNQLQKVSLEQARAVVVLSPEMPPDEADMHTLRAVLALNLASGRYRDAGRTAAGPQVVAEVADEDNRHLVELAGKGQITPVVGHDFIGRLMIQSARQDGLAHTLNSLLDFDGNEFYLKAWPELDGKSYGHARRCFPAAVLAGVRRADPAAEPRLLINPSDALVIEPGDELLCLAEDDNSYAPATPVAASSVALPDWAPPEQHPEHILFCNWRRDLEDIVVELDRFVAPGSTLTIMAELPIEERAQRLADSGIGELENLSLQHAVGSPVRKADIKALGVEQFDSVIVLADEAFESAPQEADLCALVTLLLIRDLRSRSNKPALSLISEIGDPRTKLLVAVAQISDYVVSSELISKYLAQMAEHAVLRELWDELLSAGGTEVYLKDIARYVEPDEPINFWQLADRARERGETLLGWRRGDAIEPLLNPTDKTERLRFAKGDKAVVIATD